MGIFRINLKPIVAATLVTVAFSMPGVRAQDAAADMDVLFDRLAQADEVDAARIEREIDLEWSKSGSPAMDLLLKRGREAMERNDIAAAEEHFGALTDHAPEFAEGWHGHAQAMVHQGRIGVALSDLQHVLALNPRHYDAIYGLGTIFEMIDRKGEAYDAYTLVLSIHPHHEGALQGLKRVKKAASGADL